MTLSRVALIAALATNAAWIAKAVAIAVTGQPQGEVAGALFLAGLALCVLTSVLLGLAVTSRRGLLGKIVGVLVTVVVVAAYGSIENVVVNAIAPARPGWAWGEVNLWVLMVSLLVLAVVVAVRTRNERSSRSAGTSSEQGGQVSVPA